MNMVYTDRVGWLQFFCVLYREALDGMLDPPGTHLIPSQSVVLLINGLGRINEAQTSERSVPGVATKREQP